MAAMIGAACMTVVRSAARRAGLIERTVPQVIEERMVGRATEAGRESAHRAFDQVMHLGYGASMGAAYALIAGPPRRVLPSALALAVGTWLLGGALVVPLTGAGRGVWRRSATENAVDLAAHLVFGVATELVRDDMREHERAGEVPRHERRRAALG